jgi:release factor glutamine methyltransferase
MESRSGEMHQARSEAAWTTRRLLEWITPFLQARGVDSPRVVAEMLLAHVIGCERMRLYMEVDRPASPLELQTLRELVSRAGKHEPVQYLVGEAWFFSRPFFVDRSTLIPRPSTETLVEHVLQWMRAEPGRSQPLIADIGTGTGCIAISLLAQLKAARVIATDISRDALALARRNAQRHGVTDRLELVPGDGLAPIEAHPEAGAARFDCICSNPPYIPDDEWDRIDDNVRLYEPAEALRGGPDGLRVIRPLMAGSANLLKPGGQLVIEIAHCQHEAILQLGRADALYDRVNMLKDHEGHWRVAVATRCPT